jgi:hypothetical protein
MKSSPAPQASRAFFSEMDKRFALMPFTLRAFDDEKKARMGVVECVKHGLCDPYPVIFEREGEVVAQVGNNQGGWRAADLLHP